MDSDVRLVVGVLGDSWTGNDEEDWFGLLNLSFERFENELGEQEYSSINSKEFYCDSKKAFVTRNFKNLKEQFNNGQLLLIESERSNNPTREQGYVVDYLRVQKLPSNQLFEVVNVPAMPDLSTFSIAWDKEPSTDYIMLSYLDENSKEQLVGPFKWKAEDSELDARLKLISPSRTPIVGISLSDNYSYEVPLEQLESHVIKGVIQDNTRTYLVNSKLLHTTFTKYGNRIDVMQDDKILKEYASELLKAKPFNGLTAKSLDVLKANIHMAAKSKSNKPRLIRALNLLQTADEYQQDRKTLFTELLASEQGQIRLENYIKSNEEEFFKQLRKDRLDTAVAEINDELTKLTLKEKALRITIRDLGEDADAKRKEQADMEAEYRAKAEDKVRQELEQEKVELKQKVSEIKGEIDKYRKEHSLYKTLEDLETKNKTLSEQHAGLTSLNIGLDATKKELEATIAAASVQLTEEYVRVHSLFRAMTSPAINNKSGSIFPDADTNHIVRIDGLGTPHAARREYIDAMESTLSKYNRNLSREQVVNLVVTLAQSQFTIFAGLPGSGKTSLVKIIGQAMQLGTRQHTIPVAKSWTSTKDILGYYNGLSGSYHAAPTGLWDLLNKVQEDEADKVLPVLLLLDEMNLSSPEHYFSSFLDLADTESNRQIYTGHPENQLLFIPEHIKFVGTINQDETVQPLSPRMLDRSAVILFDGIITNDKLPKEHHDLLPKYPAKDWLELFAAKGESLPDNVKIAFELISDCISINNPELGQRHIISHRKIKQIKEYIEVANSILIDFDDYVALDHAIAQYVLPMISGYGDAYGKRLKKLLDIVQNYGMAISSNLLNDIIVNGEQNLYSYQFLA